jgi:hypothetical protein
MKLQREVIIDFTDGYRERAWFFGEVSDVYEAGGCLRFMHSMTIRTRHTKAIPLAEIKQWRVTG